jgi:predicted DNA-binding transcriptional regulator AlpA
MECGQDPDCLLAAAGAASMIFVEETILLAGGQRKRPRRGWSSMSRHDDVQTLLQLTLEKQQILLERLGYRSIDEALQAVEADTTPTTRRRRRPLARGPPPADHYGRDLLRKIEVANVLGVSVWTIPRWIKRGIFPRPIYVTRDSPARWRRRDVEAFIEKRRTARRKPLKRGHLKQELSRHR